MYEETEVIAQPGPRGGDPKKLIGKWHIIESDVWDQDALDLVVPAYIKFEENRFGYFKMVAVEGGLDCRFDGDRVEFSWVGDDDGEPACGRGCACLDSDGKLRGRIFFHQGEESAFVAERHTRKR